MKGGYTDNYYMQMAQNIRRYKGVRPIPEQNGYTNIRIDGDFQELEKGKNEFRDNKRRQLPQRCDRLCRYQVCNQSAEMTSLRAKLQWVKNGSIFM